jgi:putative two-component system hydrogenase maturation factor HypX/HoxX
MKILLLTHSFNSLSQRLYAELSNRGHSLSVEFDINEQTTGEAVALFEPDLIIAPFLKRAISADIWRNYLCWIIHPGIIGDRGPSALDWAILNQEKHWGVTIIQANEVMDGGAIWASETFTMRCASKSSIYRNELSDAALKATLKALKKLTLGQMPAQLSYFQSNASRLPLALGQWRCALSQAERQLDFSVDNNETLIRKINASDGYPGAPAKLLEQEVFLFNASPAVGLSGTAGTIVAAQNNAIAVASLDGAVWVSHVRAKPKPGEKTLKLPAGKVFEAQLNTLTLEPQPTNFALASAPNEIYYRIDNDCGYLYFNFYNGAMGVHQCQELLNAYRELAAKKIKAIVLMGGDNFWSNGIDLNQIEAADSPADESWHNINAMNDLSLAIINTTDKLTVSVMRGNGGAGGVFLALACDYVIAHDGVILNPHYKSMGNLYGSEYWSYLLPKRVGEKRAQEIINNRLPLTANQALKNGLIDYCVSKTTLDQALQLILCKNLESNRLAAWLNTKQQTRQIDEQLKPLGQYRAEELAKMKLNFYGFDPSYHVARYHFVYKIDKARTPAYLAIHRQSKNKQLAK